MNQKYIVALEIGSSKIKGVVGILEENRPLSVVATEEVRFETADLLDSVRYGLIQNVDKVATTVKRIVEHLQQSPNVQPRLINAVYVGLGARSMYATEVEVEREYPEEVEITDTLVSQLMQNARNSHNLSDKEVIATTPLSFNVDGTKTNDPVGMYAHRLKAKYMVVTIKQSAVKNIRRVLCDRCGLQIAGIVVRPLAEGAAVLSDDERRLGCMLVDFGAETVTTTIYKGGVMRYLSVLPMGSRNITRDLMTLNYTEERANDLKRTVGNVEADNLIVQSRNIDGVNSREINEIIMARAQEIVANIMEQINYSGLKPQDLGDGIIVTGGGGKLNGFLSLLRNYSQMNVRLGTFQGSMRILDSRMQTDNSVDILSVLMQVAKDSPVNCTSYPTPEETGDLFNDPAEQEAMFADDDAQEEDEESSRLGADIDRRHRRRRDNKKHKAPKPEKTDESPAPFVEDTDDGDTQEEEQSHTRNPLFKAIKKRIEDLLNEGDE